MVHGLQLLQLAGERGLGKHCRARAGCSLGIHTVAQAVDHQGADTLPFDRQVPGIATGRVAVQGMLAYPTRRSGAWSRWACTRASTAPRIGVHIEYLGHARQGPQADTLGACG